MAIFAENLPYFSEVIPARHVTLHFKYDVLCLVHVGVALTLALIINIMKAH